MKLRTEFLIHVGLIFLLVAVLSYLIPTYFLDHDLGLLQADMRKSVEQDNQAHQNGMTIQLARDVNEIQSRVNFSLYRMLSLTDPEKVYLESPDRPGGTWFQGIVSLSSDYSIDFFQNTQAGKVLSLIAPSYGKLYTTDALPLEGGLYSVSLQTINASGAPEVHHLVGLELDPRRGASRDLGIKESGFTVFSDYTQYGLGFIVFAPWERILTWSNEERASFLEAINSQFTDETGDLLVTLAKYFTNPLPANIPSDAKAQALVQKIQNHKPFFDGLNAVDTLENTWHQAIKESPFYALTEVLRHDIQDAGSAGKLSPLAQFAVDHRAILNYLDPVNEMMATRLEFLKMMREFISIHDSPSLRMSPLNNKALTGMCQILKTGTGGVSLLAKDVFYSNIFFDDAAYYSQNPSVNPKLPLANSLFIMNPQPGDMILIGNTIQVKNQTNPNEPPGYVTTGIRINELIKNLALQAGHRVLMAIGTDVCVGYNPDGTEMKKQEYVQFPVEKMLGSEYGMADSGNTRYIFYRIPLVQNTELQLLLIEEEVEAFSVFYTLQGYINKIKEKISIQLLLVVIVLVIAAFFIVNKVTRKIVNPITVLARATKDVAEGQWHKVSFPAFKKVSLEISTLANSFEEMAQGLSEREKVRAVLDKVVSKDIAAEILKDGVQLGGDEKRVAILFADIRGFTKESETMTPQEVIHKLNSFMTRMSAVIMKHHGVIDKYVGDEIMAIYGAPIKDAQSAKNAIDSAIEMMQSLEEWNKERLQKGRKRVDIGIGVHIGQVVAGNMGTVDRLNYTVLGANVNLASRLCAAAEEKTILVSEAVVTETGIKDVYAYEDGGSVELKGFSQPIKVYKIKWDQKEITKASNKEPHQPEIFY